MAAPGYGPGAGSPGVSSPEDSTRDVGRISLEFRGAPESSQDARRSNTRLERAPSTPPWPAAGSPSPSPGLGAGRRSGPFPAPGNAWAPAVGHHVGAPGVARCSAPEDCSRKGPSPAPNWPERLSRPGFSPQTYLEGPQTSSADRKQAPDRPQTPGLPQLESPVAWRPYSPIAAPLARTWRRQRRRRQLQR